MPKGLAWQGILQNIDRKTVIFSSLNLLLGLGYAWGIFSSNAMLITRSGTEGLFYIYLGSSLASLLLAGALYWMLGRYSHRRVFFLSFEFLGGCVVLAWLIAWSGPRSMNFYFVVRIFAYAIFILTTLQFWIVVGDYYTNFEAKLRYPYFIAFGVVGELIGSVTVHQFATKFHAANFLLLWGLALMAIPFLFLRIQSSKQPKEEASEENSKTEKTASKGPSSLRWLFYLMMFFWTSHVFMAYGLDFFYNTSALERFGNEDELAAFFGKVGNYSMALVLIYQVFFAAGITRKFGLERALYGLGVLYVVGLSAIHFFPSLAALAVAECLIFFFAELAAESLLQPVNKTLPPNKRAKMMVVEEAVAFPGGTLLLLLVAFLAMTFATLTRISLALFVSALLFLAGCFLFGRVYLRYLTDSLRAADSMLALNAIQALGEPNKKKAVPALIGLLAESTEVSMKRAIILSLGKIRDPAAFKEITDCFSIPNESIQLAVVESLSHFEKKEGVSALYRLVQSNENVSFQVRMKATYLLTQMLGSKMKDLLLDELADSQNDRVKANVIESLALLKDPSTIPLLLPYLNHASRRIRANTAIALFPFGSTRPQALQTIEGLFNSKSAMEMFAGIYAIGELRLSQFRQQLLQIQNTADKRLRQQSTIALAKMGDPQACERISQLLLDPEPGFFDETAKHLGRFPRGSRNRVFEAISRLPTEEKDLIISRLDQTPLDFSKEKELLQTPGWVAAHIPL